MHRAVAVCGIKPDLDPHVVAHFASDAHGHHRAVQIKVAQADRHHACATGPWVSTMRMSTKRLAPARLDGSGAGATATYGLLEYWIGATKEHRHDSGRDYCTSRNR